VASKGLTYSKKLTKCVLQLQRLVGTDGVENGFHTAIGNVLDLTTMFYELEKVFKEKLKCQKKKVK